MVTRMVTSFPKINPVDLRWKELAEQRQLQLTKPPGSLGRLEEIANRLASIQRTDKPAVSKPMVVVFAGDHGVCEERVNPYPQAVTAQMVSNFLQGGAAINAVARSVGAELLIVDVGVGRGTKNFCREPAMTRDETWAALNAGIESVDRVVNGGADLIAVGEMGIGNSTVASAITAALTGMDPKEVVGRGTGADDACMQRKIGAISKALELHRPVASDPLGLLQKIGGFEIAAIAGACLQGAARSCPVLVDGFIATAAAALAVKIDAAVRPYLFAAHRSTEPGHRPLLEILGDRPILDLSMRLGEGSGAALAIPILRAAADTLSRMATFQEAGVAT